MPAAEQILNQRYQLIQPLGEDASRQTWLATDLTHPDQITVVMKLLAMSPQMQWDEAKLLEREAQILQKLDHPRIPHYADYFMLDQLADSRFSWFCLVQSYVPGFSLQQLLDRGRHFTEAEIEKIATEALSILVYLHEFTPPILHRDIKPSNLIWGEDDRLYLIDFGSVQDQAALEGATFTVVGTYGYVPMEQFGGRAVPASDLYALGATLVHLLTGTAPADLPHQNARLQFAQQVSIDPAFVNWVSMLIEPDLTNRLSTARQALDALSHRQHLSLPTVSRKPKGSQIQLKKAIDHLELKIPARGWQAVSWLYCLSTIGGFGYLVFQLPQMLNAPWIFWGVSVVWIFALLPVLSAALMKTTIRGDRTHFTIYHKLLGLTVRHKLKTARIHPVQGVYEQEKIGAKGIMIQAGNKLLATNPMAEVERHWVIQEIRDWLNPGQSKIQPQNTTAMPEQGNRIQINESIDELLIQYSGKEHYGKVAAIPLLLIGLGLAAVFYPFLNLFSLGLSILILPFISGVGAALYGFYFPTVLCFKGDRFFAYKRIFGYKWKLFQGLTSDVEELTEELVQKLKDKGIVVAYLVIRTRRGDHTFGRGFTKFERQWIVDRIVDWLQLTDLKTPDRSRRSKE